MRQNLTIIVFKFAYCLLKALGLLLSLIPRHTRYVCFIGHLGFYNGNAKFLFQSCIDNLGSAYCRSQKVEFIFFHRRGETPVLPTEYFKICHIANWLDSLRYAKYLFFSRVLVITTPGYDWKWRLAFAQKGRKVLVSNGVPLKAPGVLSPHFDALKSAKYLHFWRDIDQLWVSSELERYIAAASLKVPIEKIFIRGAARQTLFYSSKFSARRATSVDMLAKHFGNDIRNSKRVLIALTQRAYLGPGGHTAVDSLKALDGFTEDLFLSHKMNDNVQYFIREHFLTDEQSAAEQQDLFSFMGPNVVAELNDVIAGFDVIISDYSGLYLDLLHLDIPIGLLRFAGDDFIERRGLILPDAVLSHSLTVRSLNDLITLTKRDQLTQDQKNFRQQMHRLFFSVPAEECEALNRTALQRIIER